MYIVIEMHVTNKLEWNGVLKLDHRKYSPPLLYMEGGGGSLLYMLSRWGIMLAFGIGSRVFAGTWALLVLQMPSLRSCGWCLQPCLWISYLLWTFRRSSLQSDFLEAIQLILSPLYEIHTYADLILPMCQ